MVEKLKEELSSKEASLMHGKRGTKERFLSIALFYLIEKFVSLLTLAKQLLERDLNSLKKTVEDYKKSENERKNHGIQQEKQLQKLQLLLQQVNGELRESTLQTQAVRRIITWCCTFNLFKDEWLGIHVGEKLQCKHRTTIFCAKGSTRGSSKSAERPR